MGKVGLLVTWDAYNVFYEVLLILFFLHSTDGFRNIKSSVNRKQPS